ncbi:MAG: hypothetical protein IJ356_01570 [Erysipelotrichaceae bacterium]|nr:hypothetical protein [Erysipelotrichaceae bacterium]
MVLASFLIIYLKISILKSDKRQRKANLILLEDLVPDNHILRKIDKVIDFSFIYEYLEPLYSEICRPSIDPVILFKLTFS